MCPPLPAFNELLRLGNFHRERQSVDKVRCLLLPYLHVCLCVYILSPPPHTHGFMRSFEGPLVLHTPAKLPADRTQSPPFSRAPPSPESFPHCRATCSAPQLIEVMHNNKMQVNDETLALLNEHDSFSYAFRSFKSGSDGKGHN